MSQSIPRRQFLRQSACLLSAGVVLPSSLSCVEEVASMNLPEENTLPIVDTHQHLWDLKKFHLPWLKGEGVKSINRSFVMTDYLEATKGLDVRKTVYMEVNVDADEWEKEAEYAIDLCKNESNPMAAAVIGGAPQSKSFKKYIEKYAKSKFVKGVRTVLHDSDRPKGMCLQSQFVENMKLLGKLNLRFDLCMRPGEINDGAKLAEKCSGTKFVIDHCGNMSVTSTDQALRKSWVEGMKQAAALENTVCKISGIVATAEKEKWKPADLAENIEFCLETFGEVRVFFGGDWPVCTLKSSFAEWVHALKWIVRDKSVSYQKKLFHDNAVKFYGLG